MADKFWSNIVQELLPDFGVTLKIRKKSNFDRNELKLETQHKHRRLQGQAMRAMPY